MIEQWIEPTWINFRIPDGPSMETPTPPKPSDEGPNRRLPVRLLAAGMIGNVMEWYDFAVYGYFAATMGRQFFPLDNPTNSLIASFSVFAAGMLMRPLGGMLFGHIGDRIGRKPALTLSVLAMAIPTFLIGLLPGYATLGILAPILLTALRMIQGLSVGGEYTTSVVFLVESSPIHRRGFAGSWSTFGSVAGILLGSAIGALVTATLPVEAVDHWAWRVPFLVGLLVGLLGLYIRNQIPEPPKPEGYTSSPPVWQSLRSHWRIMLQVGGLTAVNSVAFYVAFVFLVTYMQWVGSLTEAIALEINTINMAVVLALCPLSGWLADQVGRKPMTMIGTVGLLVLSMPIFWLLHHPSEVWNFIGQLLFAILIGLSASVFPVLMVETTPHAVRCSVVSVGYNLCVGLMGGLAPVGATWLISMTGNDYAPVILLIGGALVTFFVLIRLPETMPPRAVELEPAEKHV